MEKIIIKFFIYGFLSGIYYYLLFKEKVRVQKIDGQYHYSHLPQSEYILEMLRFSALLSIIAGIIGLIYGIYKKSKNQL